MGDGMVDSSALRLKQISPEDERSLVFSFDSPAGELHWTFEPASMAEFLALLLGGAMRSGRGVSIPHAAVSVKASKAGAAELSVSIGPVDLIATLDDAALATLAASIARVQAALHKR
jgi:hypothetical protein